MKWHFLYCVSASFLYHNFKSNFDEASLKWVDHLRLFFSKHHFSFILIPEWCSRFLFDLSLLNRHCQLPLAPLALLPTTPLSLKSFTVSSETSQIYYAERAFSAYLHERCFPKLFFFSFTTFLQQLMRNQGAGPLSLWQGWDTFRKKIRLCDVRMKIFVLLCMSKNIRFIKMSDIRWYQRILLFAAAERQNGCIPTRDSWPSVCRKKDCNQRWPQMTSVLKTCKP